MCNNFFVSNGFSIKSFAPALTDSMALSILACPLKDIITRSLKLFFNSFIISIPCFALFFSHKSTRTKSKSKLFSFSFLNSS